RPRRAGSETRRRARSAPSSREISVGVAAISPASIDASRASRCPAVARACLTRLAGSPSNRAARDSEVRLRRVGVLIGWCLLLVGVGVGGCGGLWVIGGGLDEGGQLSGYLVNIDGAADLDLLRCVQAEQAGPALTDTDGGGHQRRG